MAKQVRHFISILLVYSFLCSCGWRHRPAYTKKMPERNKIVGIWVPDKASLSLIGTAGGYDLSKEIKIVLQEDGKLEMLNIPDWWGDNGRGESNKSFKSYSGTWEMSQEEDRVTLNIIYSGIFTGLGLLNDSDPYKIEFIIGDPDENREMIFVRQKE